MLLPRVRVLVAVVALRDGVLHHALDCLLELVAGQEGPSQQWTVDMDAVSDGLRVFVHGQQRENHTGRQACAGIPSQDLLVPALVVLVGVALLLRVIVLLLLVIVVLLLVPVVTLVVAMCVLMYACMHACMYIRVFV